MHERREHPERVAMTEDGDALALVFLLEFKNERGHARPRLSQIFPGPISNIEIAKMRVPIRALECRSIGNVLYFSKPIIDNNRNACFSANDLSGLFGADQWRRKNHIDAKLFYFIRRCFDARNSLRP